MMLMQISRVRVGCERPILSARFARTWFQRLRGLLGRPELPEHMGMLLAPCNSVHTLGMCHPIDVVFLDAEGTVIHTREWLRPGRFAAARGAAVVLELRAGRLRGGWLRVGDRLCWKAVTEL